MKRETAFHFWYVAAVLAILGLQLFWIPSKNLFAAPVYAA
jgi:hypothetical protein